jgi:hypothetical protein
VRRRVERAIHAGQVARRPFSKLGFIHFWAGIDNARPLRERIPPCGLTENTTYSIPEACSESTFPLSGKPSSSVSVATTTVAIVYRSRNI